MAKLQLSCVGHWICPKTSGLPAPTHPDHFGAMAITMGSWAKGDVKPVFFFAFFQPSIRLWIKKNSRGQETTGYGNIFPFSNSFCLGTRFWPTTQSCHPVRPVMESLSRGKAYTLGRPPGPKVWKALICFSHILGWQRADGKSSPWCCNWVAWAEIKIGKA